MDDLEPHKKTIEQVFGKTLRELKYDIIYISSMSLQNLGSTNLLFFRKWKNYF